jgi:hypothetical protein
MCEEIFCLLIFSFLEILMRHNNQARDIIETLYRHLKSNYIWENFCYTEDFPDVLDSLPKIPPQMNQNFENFSSKNEELTNQALHSSTLSGHLSQVENKLLSSNASLRSFTVGNNSSLYLSNPSNLNDSGRLKMVNKRRNTNAWEVCDEKCFFQPIKNSFYQKYVLKYTKFRPKLRQKRRKKKKVEALAKSLVINRKF